MANVVLVTTKWKQVGEEVGEARQEQLKTSWATKLGNRSVMARYMDTHKSAWDIVDLILPKDRLNALLIRREPFDFKQPLPEIRQVKILKAEEALRRLALKYSKDSSSQAAASSWDRRPDDILVLFVHESQFAGWRMSPQFLILS
jgi:hypothetical protein